MKLKNTCAGCWARSSSPHLGREVLRLASDE
jgi:hypothetical protein